jgi:hypothetical protein
MGIIHIRYCCLKEKERDGRKRKRRIIKIIIREIKEEIEIIIKNEEIIRREKVKRRVKKIRNIIKKK